MTEQKICGIEGEEQKGRDYETVRIEKTGNVCPFCEDYAKDQASKPVAIMSCEGACLRGEVARRAANIICHSLAPDKTVRICLGSAFTKDTGQRNLVRKAKRVIALEGCFINCSSRMMKGVIEELEPEVMIADKFYSFNRSLFGINEMSEDEINTHSQEVAKKIVMTL
jgi:uncharacterized metal-binding protein